MKAIFYEAIIKVSRITGIWVLAFFAWLIAAIIFFISPKLVTNNLTFFKAVFPEKNIFARLAIVWQQFHHFATGVVDRIRLEQADNLLYETIGLEQFEQHHAQGQGGIFLMSHFGNWEIAARLFHRQNIPLILHLGQKEKEHIEKIQKKDLAADGIKIVSAPKDGGSPFDLIESIRLLRQGGYVSIAGDRVQNKSQRQLETDFMGHKVHLPMAPHLLAMLSEVPIFILFTIRLKPGNYKVIIGKPYYVKKAKGQNRTAGLKQSTETYLLALEEMIRKYPEHWYHFEPFLHEERKPLLTKQLFMLVEL